MGHKSILTASMAGEEQLVFHDFLGITCHTVESVQLKVPVASSRLKNEVEGAVKSATTSTGHFDDFPPSIAAAEQLSWPRGSLPTIHRPELTTVRQGKRRDSAGSGDSLPRQLQMGAGASETSPHLKVSRFERLDDGRMEAGRDFTMQPPRMSSNVQSSQPSLAVKPALHMAMSSQWDNSRHQSFNNFMFGPTQGGLLNLHSDKLALNNGRENSGMVPGPPADEGSRTGLKGSSAGILLNSPSTNLVPGATHTSPSPGRSKSWSQSAGSEFTYAASQQATAPTSRQLTIFYGGQAHVFDDVPSDKADAIMTLAGSSGRSWSTMYTPRPKASVPDLGSEVPQSIIDGEKSSISKASAVDCAGQSASEAPRATLHSDAKSSQNHQISDRRGLPVLS